MDDSYQGWLCAVSEANPQKKKKVQEETEETTSDDVSLSKGKDKGKEKAKARGGLAPLAVSNDTLHESAQVLQGKERARIGSRHNSGSNGKGNDPDHSYGKGGVSVTGQEGLFNFSQQSCVNTTQWPHDHWNVNEVDNNGESNWPGRLAQMRKTKKIEKIELASQFAETAGQFQLVKRRKKVSWERLDCQDELHKSMTHNRGY